MMESSGSGEFVRRIGQVIHSTEREVLRSVVVCCEIQDMFVELSVPMQNEGSFKHGGQVTGN
jgi:hypothetical protein